MEENEVFTCCLLLKNNSIMLGSSYGNIYIGQLRTPSEVNNLEFNNNDNIEVITKISEKILSFQGSIRTIENLNENNILILSSYGDIICYSIKNRSHTEIQKGKSSKFSKTWRLLVIDEDRFITIGNYKKLMYWYRSGDNFESNTQPEFQEFNEKHAYFCLNWFEGKNIFLINNFKGHTELWEVNASGISRIARDTLEGNLQDFLTINNDYLITVDYFGYIYVFRIEDHTFKKVFEFKISSNQGNIVYYSPENELILIGTNNELIFLENDFQKVYKKDVPVKQIFRYGNIDLILSSKGIIRLNFDKKEVPESIINYRYKKIGLIGDHDVGKTTFCRYLKKGSLSDEDLTSEESSLGRHVWTISVEDSNEQDNKILSFLDDDISKKILYFDIAGQKSEHFTYFPILYDSDIILLFYQGTSRETFDQVLKYYLELKNRCSKANFFIIQTHSEQHQRITDRYLKRELIRIGLDDTILIKIDSKTGKGYNDFKEIVLENIDWNSAPTVIEMPIFNNLMEFFDQLYMSGKSSSISLEDLPSMILNLDEQRLENIILSLYKKGIIQYLEEDKRILINNEEYETMHSEITNLIDEEYGYIKTKLIYKELGNNLQKKKFIKNILKYFKDNEIGIIFKENSKKKETHIFPRKLRSDLYYPNQYEDLIPKNLTKFKFSDNLLQLESFIAFLDIYPLDLISISKSEILFKIDHEPDNALLYLNISRKESFKVCSIGINKIENVDYQIEKEILSFILENIGNYLNDVSFKSNQPSLQGLDIEEQVKILLKTTYERPFLDFKTEYNLNTKAEKAEFLKDTIALTNSAVFNENMGFLIIGIEEKDGQILNIFDISNSSLLEEKSAVILNDYLNNFPLLDFYEIKIHDLYEWQENEEISNQIPFTENQKDPSNEDKLLVIRINRLKETVCDIKKKIHFEKKGKQKLYDRGWSWWRINSYTFPISEIEKQILRNK
ncbi:MAG: hypothetical protein GF311_10725 [Candidatus Lokiarchaeota archaeon]|nr:hypothetical protein [Candidatus Lokiarchaeota archaeon]